jgi:SAM-dependent methyltransferase
MMTFNPNQNRMDDPFQLDRVACFGRTMNEYVEMFNLDLENLKGKSILDCASGPASFAAEAQKLDLKVVACDPIYSKQIDDIMESAQRDIPACIRETQRHRSLFMRQTNDDDITFLNEKLKALTTFANDYRRMDACRRYVAASFPHLPFYDDSFDMVLCGNLLFLYSNVETGGILENSNFDYLFHHRALHEMLRIARQEVRIYPVVGPNKKTHPFIEQLLNDESFFPYDMQFESVMMKDIRGATQMLRIFKRGI